MRILWLLVVITLTGCGSISLGELRSNNNLRDVRIFSEADSNRHTAARVDIVFVYRKDLVASFPLRSEVWFSQREQLALQFGEVIDVVKLEIVPLSYLRDIALPKLHRSAYDVLVYSDAGIHSGESVPKFQRLSEFECTQGKVTDVRIEFTECET